MELRTATAILQLDERTGALRSLQDLKTGVEFIAPGTDRPAFLIELLDEEGRFTVLSSLAAARVDIRPQRGAGQTAVTAVYERIGGLDLTLICQVRASERKTMSRWTFSVTNATGQVISHVQFPFVVVPYQLEGGDRTETVLWAHGTRELHEHPAANSYPADTPEEWRWEPHLHTAFHYPGWTYAQLQAFYDRRSGLYLAAEDPGGHVKFLQPLTHPHGLRLGVGHYLGWDQPGPRELGYDVVLGTFHGDWHAAAEIYRTWSHGQSWLAGRLRERQDVPAWLLDSPVLVILRLQGELDAAPGHPSPDFIPLDKSFVHLKRFAEAVQAPLVPILMAYERAGPWIYPDWWPPIDGHQGWKAFTARCREEGWHVGVYCNGTRWVLGHKYTGYDGHPYYKAEDGEETVCRLPDGRPWLDRWDRHWRPSYLCCLDVRRTREIAADFIRSMLDLGVDWIQFLDQNVGGVAFPCYARDHGHPSAPGRWQVEALKDFTSACRELALQQGRPIAFSVEGWANEVFASDFAICDIRPTPQREFVPLFHYLHHEHILTQSAFAEGPVESFLPVKTAYAFVRGDLVTAILGKHGSVVNYPGNPWTPRDIPLGDQDGAVTFLRRGAAMRRGVGRDYLVFGRMLPPITIEEVPVREWEEERLVWGYPATEEEARTMRTFGSVTRKEKWRLPMIVAEVWQAPDGRRAVALANWSREPATCQLQFASTEVRAVVEHLSDVPSRRRAVGAGGFHLALPPLSVGLLELLSHG